MTPRRSVLPRAMLLAMLRQQVDGDTDYRHGWLIFRFAPFTYRARGFEPRLYFASPIALADSHDKWKRLYGHSKLRWPPP